MNAAASAGSSCAISSSIFAQIGTARVLAPLTKSCMPASSTALSACGRSSSSRFRTISSGFAERNWKPRSRRAILRRQLEVAQRLAGLERVRQRCRISCSFFSSALRRLSSGRARAVRAGVRRRRGLRGSASSSIVRTSRAGSIEPAACGTDGSRNMRTTWSSASALRNGATSRSAAAPPLLPDEPPRPCRRTRPSPGRVFSG